MGNCCVNEKKIAALAVSMFPSIQYGSRTKSFLFVGSFNFWLHTLLVQRGPLKFSQKQLGFSRYPSAFSILSDQNLLISSFIVSSAFLKLLRINFVIVRSSTPIHLFANIYCNNNMEHRNIVTETMKKETYTWKTSSFFPSFLITG